MFLWVLVAGGCGASPADECAQAKARFEECGLHTPSDLDVGCTDRATAVKAAELATADCATLAEMASSGGKADGMGGWSFWVEAGDRCWTTFQCLGDQVCRLAAGDSKVCADPLAVGDSCHADSDCGYCPVSTAWCQPEQGDWFCEPEAGVCCWVSQSGKLKCSQTSN
jgi:hypothetical protein